MHNLRLTNWHGISCSSEVHDGIYVEVFHDEKQACHNKAKQANYTAQSIFVQFQSGFFVPKARWSFVWSEKWHSHRSSKVVFLGIHACIKKGSLLASWILCLERFLVCLFEKHEYITVPAIWRSWTHVWQCMVIFSPVATSMLVMLVTSQCNHSILVRLAGSGGSGFEQICIHVHMMRWPLNTLLVLTCQRAILLDLGTIKLPVPYFIAWRMLQSVSLGGGMIIKIIQPYQCVEGFKHSAKVHYRSFDCLHDWLLT